MTDNSKPQEVNSSTIINHLLKFILNHKFGLVAIVVLSIAYTLFIRSNYQPLYISTAILDTKEIIKRDVMKEMVHDYFKSTNHSSIKSHLIRTDTIKDGTRLYLDLYSHLTTYDSIEKELNSYLIKSEIIQLNIINKRKVSTLIIDELNKQISSDSLEKKNGFVNGTKNKLELIKEIEKQNEFMLIIDTYNPFEKSFGVADEIEKIRNISVKNFIKAFLSGIILLIILPYFKKKLAS